MTVVYNDYYNAFDNKTMDITNVSFLVILVDDKYIPNSSDKLDDVVGDIISVPYVIVDNDIVTLGMGELINKSEENIKEYIELYPNEISEEYRYDNDVYKKGKKIVVFNPSLNILCFSEDLMNIE